MIKLNIICVGNIKDRHYIDASEEYKKRLSRFCDLKIVELKEHNEQSSIQKIKNLEGDEIIKHAKGFVVLMDVNGKLISSEDLAVKIQQISNTNSEITFIIGGSYGVSEEVKKVANQIISVSKMTFPHMLFRVMLLEQIYRAFTINNNIAYHK